jgi:hypothetical protein
VKLINGKRRFGCWAGNPDGRAEDPACCIEEVFPGRGTSYQCTKKRGHGPNGEFCRIHYPEAVAKRAQERDAKYDKAHAIQQRRWNDEIVGAHLRNENPQEYDRILKKRSPHNGGER